jgi:integrase/recombinase XerD
VDDPGNLALAASWELSLHAKAPRTVGQYLAELARFADWLESSGRPKDLLAVGRRDVEAYIRSLQAAGRAKATIRSRWIALRSFYAWAVEEEELDESPLARVKVDKADAPHTPLLSDDEIRRLLKVCEGRAFEDRRDLALIRVLIATGLRASEVVALKAADVDLRNRLVYVHHGKGDKARIARFDPATSAAVDRYIRARARHRLAARPELWLGHRGPLTRKGLGPMLDKRTALAGLGHVHPHALRHLFASRFLEAGGQEGDLQRLGGWANAEVMRRYGSARAVDRALAAYDQASPLGDL